MTDVNTGEVTFTNTSNQQHATSNTGEVPASNDNTGRRILKDTSCKFTCPTKNSDRRKRADRNFSPSSRTAPYLHESVPESPGEGLAAPVRPRRVLSGKQPEVGVRFDGLLGLGEVQLAVVVQQPVQGLQHLSKFRANYRKN